MDTFIIFLLILHDNNTTFLANVRIFSILMSSIGKNIRKIRTIKGLSQTEFANLFDLTRASISAYEEGRADPKIDATLKIAKYFNIPIEALLSHEITVNEFARFNLQNIISEETRIEMHAIPIVSARNWDVFLKSEKTADFPTMRCPTHWLQGELAVEVHEKIHTDLHKGTLLLCTREKDILKNAVYLKIDQNTAAVLNGHQIDKTKKMRLYRIFQKIEEMQPTSANSVEDRLEKIEKQIQKILKK